GFDLESGERLWQVDVGAELDLVPPAGDPAFAVAASGADRYLVQARRDDDWPGLIEALELDRDGQVVARWSASGDEQLLRHGDDLIRVSAAGQAALHAPGDRERSAWEADLGLDWQNLRNDETGSLWLLGNDGFVDLETGRPLGFGADAAAGSVSYHAFHGNEDGLLRLDEDSGELRRLEPTSGEDLWDQPLALEAPLLAAYWMGGRLALEYSLEGEASGYQRTAVMAVDAAGGEPLWRREIGVGRIAGVTAHGVVAAAYGRLSLIDWTSGEEAGSERLADDELPWALGSRVLYVWDNAGSIRALDCQEGLTELWSLGVSEAAFDGETGWAEGAAWSGIRLFVRISTATGGFLRPLHPQ
ncbi:MAG: hypothetical protein LBD90_00940, partial [Bifidobacteriaceae bacterium]|nr:hypothetical protein [Bifidobacteriaceae bacterium]